MMKKKTFAVWFTALMAVFTFSSCLNDDYNGEIVGSEAVKVSGGLGFYEFKTKAGFTLTPINMEALTMNITSNYAYIIYSYKQEAVNQETKRVPVTMKGISPIYENHAISSMEGIDEHSNAPIRNITTQVSYDSFPVFFWNKTTMFLPITFFVENLSADKMEAEVKKHTFRIYYDVNDPENNASNLVLHVRHHVVDPDKNNNRTNYYTSIFEVDLRYALSQFKEKFNTDVPETISIEYKENYVGSYDETQIQSKTVQVNYSTLVENQKQ